MNNDAKDLIGRARAVNLVLLLLKIDRFAFPLDAFLQVSIDHHRSQFLDMASLLSQLTHFESEFSELLSCIDDIVDPAVHVYTQNNVDMLLSLYEGRDTINTHNYHDRNQIAHMLGNVCKEKVCDVAHSVMWLRIAFGSCYPDSHAIPLRDGWFGYCKLVCDVGGKDLGWSHLFLVRSSLSHWRSSEMVVGNLAPANLKDMPHRSAFMAAVSEVDDVLLTL